MSLLVGWKTTLGYVPKQGSRAIKVPLTFFSGGVTSINWDFFKEQSNGELEFAQSAFIDNSLNSAAVAFQFSGLEQVLTVRNQTQGYYPLFLPNGRLSFTATCVGATADASIILSNIFINPSVWSVV